MSKHRHLPHLLMLAGFLVVSASAVVGQVNTAKPAQINTGKPGEPVERHLPADQTFREWSLEPNPNSTDDVKRIKVCRVETVCTMRYKEGQTPRTRVRNLVAPLRYEDESSPISEAFTIQVQQALSNLPEKPRVTVALIGDTDG